MRFSPKYFQKHDLSKEKAFLRQMFKKFSKQNLFKKKQHLYSSPLGFTPWKEILGHLFLYDTAFPATVNSINRCDAEASIAAGYSLEHDSPVRHITKNLGEAFLKTSTKGVIKPPIALEHFIINLPKDLLFDELNQPMIALLVMTGECFEKACVERKVEYVKLGFEGLYTIGFCDHGAVFIDTTKWGNMDHEEGVTPQSIWFDPNYKSQARAAAAKMRQIAVHSLLTMAYRPELLSESKPISSGHSFRELGFEGHKQTRNNVWIGEEFVSKTRKRLQSDDREGSPVASHWRRGHWHTYLIGQKREKQSLKWIEPIHVNAEVV
tara:strand:+ start:176 stop:1141 length:966 start_codon:yes stop_codon:yes gene_type:complete